MLAKLKQIITGRTDQPTAEIEITTVCFVNGATVNPGDRLTLPVKEADNLVAYGRAFHITTADQKAHSEHLASLVPPPWIARPLSEIWLNLPEPFHQLWELNERFRCARGRADDTEACVLRGHGLTAAELAQFAQETSRANGGLARSAIVNGWLQSRTPQLRISIEIGENDFKSEERRRLVDALDRQHQAIAELVESHSEEFIRLKFLCGDLALEENARASRFGKELAGIGFEIFCKRVEALALGESENRRLFNGTREKLLYAQPVNKPSGLCLAWSDRQTGESRHYLSGSIDHLAGQYRTFNTEAARLEGLLKQAKSELSRANKALAAA